MVSVYIYRYILINYYNSDSLINCTLVFSFSQVNFKANTKDVKLQQIAVLFAQPRSPLIMGTINNRGFTRYCRMPTMNGVV